MIIHKTYKLCSEELNYVRLVPFLVEITKIVK